MTDTLATFKKLTDAGMAAAQAEIIVSELWDMQHRRTNPPRLAEPARYSKNALWNWYVGNSSRHPFLNGAGTGLVLVAVEWTIFFPLLDSVLVHLCPH